MNLSQPIDVKMKKIKIKSIVENKNFFLSI